LKPFNRNKYIIFLIVIIISIFTISYSAPAVSKTVAGKNIQETTPETKPVIHLDKYK
jgi:hypothetical protein